MDYHQLYLSPPSGYATLGVAEADSEAGGIPSLPKIEQRRHFERDHPAYQSALRDVFYEAQWSRKDRSRDELWIGTWNDDTREYTTAVLSIVKSLGHTHRRDRRSVQGHGSNQEKVELRDDAELFEAIKLVYQRRLCPWRRRIFSYKTVSSIKILQFGDGSRFFPPIDDRLYQEKFMSMYERPRERSKRDQSGNLVRSTKWAQWIRKTKDVVAQENCDIMIELVTDNDMNIVALFGVGTLLVVLVLCVIWLGLNGDPNEVCQVMGFVLSFGVVAAALLALCDRIQTPDMRDLRGERG